jgi:tetratricopeptide (TPR) repeat protein
VVLSSLGRSLCDQGQPRAAERVYREELAGLTRLEQNKDVQRQTGAAHTDLADVLAGQGRYAEARKEYEASLAIKKQIGGEERGIAVVTAQLGTLAMRMNDRVEARRHYQDAQQIFHAIGEAKVEAQIWTLLGNTNLEESRFDEAARCYTGIQETCITNTEHRLG